MLLPKFIIMAQVAAAAFFRPAEWDRQSRVIMAWPSAANEAYKDDAKGLAAVTKDVSTIADAVALFEPVTVLVTPDRVAEAQKRFKKNPAKITVKQVDGYPRLDLWTRDMAPTFVVNDDNNSARLYGVDFNFNGWGNKYPTGQSVSLASIVSHDMQVPSVRSSLVTEGGSLEIDGEGTIILTESSILNNNRNPGKSRQDVEAELRRTLGVEKFIWIPGRKGLEVTDGHIDGLARFVSPGHVVLSRPSELDNSDWTRIYQEAYDVLYEATDAKGRHLEITEITEADMYAVGIDKKTLKDIESGEEDAPAYTYVNYLLLNDGVIFPQFGDKKADAAALKIIRSLYQNREVEPVCIDELPFFGGGIHCSTQEVPVPMD